MEKIYGVGDEIMDFFLTGKKLAAIYLVFQIIFSAITIIVVYNYNGSWEKVFYYPEAEYQEIEKEAKRMAETKDFETKYECTKSIKDNIANTLTFEIKGEKGESVEVIIENYGNNDEIITIERALKTARGKVFICVFLIFFLIPALCSMMLIAVILLIVVLLILVETITYDRKKRKQIYNK